MTKRRGGERRFGRSMGNRGFNTSTVVDQGLVSYLVMFVQITGCDLNEHACVDPTCVVERSVQGFIK